MRFLTSEEADRYLNTVGMKVGEWHRIEPIDARAKSKQGWFNYRAPRDALALYAFSALMIDWFSRGDWKILQLDNSNHFPRVAELLLSRTLGMKRPIDFAEVRTFIFEDTNDDERIQNQVVIAGVIYSLLMFEGHAYIVSSADGGYRLGVQDGFIYFQGTEEAIARGRTVVKRFEDGGMANWQSEVETAWQDRILGER